jgi:hypothetical protein
MDGKSVNRLRPGAPVSAGRKVKIALGLIEMRKAGKLDAVFIDGDRVRVVDDGTKHLISWEAAERRVLKWRLSKG